MSEQKKPDLGLLEEDDEFEEFPAEGKTTIYILYHNLKPIVVTTKNNINVSVSDNIEICDVQTQAKF